jgi:hypothetical protein
MMIGEAFPRPALLLPLSPSSQSYKATVFLSIANKNIYAYSIYFVDTNQVISSNIDFYQCSWYNLIKEDVRWGRQGMGVTLFGTVKHCPTRPGNALAIYKQRSKNYVKDDV